MGFHFLPQGIFLEIEPGPPTLQADSLPSEPPSKHQKVLQKAVCQISIPYTQTHPLLGCTSGLWYRRHGQQGHPQGGYHYTLSGQNPEVTSTLKVHPYTLLRAFKHQKVVLLRQAGTLNTKFCYY